MPIDYTLYPPDWPQIRQRILDRDRPCQKCGLINHTIGWRDPTGAFHPWPSHDPSADTTWIPTTRLIKIILTIAHLDHDLTNNTDANLAALCQRCHLTHDIRQHTLNAARTRRRKHIAAGQLEIFP